MARVINTDVKAIMDTVSITDGQIDAYIVGANALVNSVFGIGVSDILTQIECWMAAHMIASTTERMAAKEGAGGASIEYTGKWDENLGSTPYGQMVKVLDSTGRMATLGKPGVIIYAVPGV